MSTIELRNKVHGLINSIQDVNRLEAILTFLKGSKEFPKDWWDELTESNEMSIKKGMEDVENENVFSNEIALERIQKFKSKYI